MNLLSPFITGFLIGGGLIIAIGAQNAFVLRQGIRREHVFIVCLICAVSDAVLIAVGVAGLGAIIERLPVLLNAITLFGISFLGWYGVLAIRRVLAPEGAMLGGGESIPLRQAVLTCLTFTFLNPHVYLDTVLLVGSLAAPFSGAARWAYGIGAATASFAWFFGLGYGARILAPLFVQAKAWRILDAIIAIVMFAIAINLILWMMAR